MMQKWQLKKFYDFEQDQPKLTLAESI